MSKFHFDENVMNTVTANLKTISENISSTESKINNVVKQLYYEKGFDIDKAVNALSAEIVNVSRCVEKSNIINDAINQIMLLINQSSLEANLIFSYFLNLFNNIKNSETFGTEFNEFNHPVVECVQENNNLLTELSLLLRFDDEINNFLSGILKYRKLDGLERANTKEALVEVLSSMVNYCEYPDYLNDVSAYLKERSNFSQIPGTADNLYDIIKSQIKNIPKDPDKFEKYFSEYKTFSNIIGSVVDISKISMDVALDWFKDYSYAMKYLDTLSDVADSGSYDSLAIDIVNELKAEYSKNFLAILKNNFDEFIVKKKTELLTPFKGAKSIYNIMDFSADMISKYSGTGEIADNYNKLSGLVVMQGHVQAEYNAVINEMKSGNLSDEVINHYNNLFELNKSVRISEFETMIKLTNPNRHSTISEYEAKIEKLKNMSSGI